MKLLAQYRGSIMGTYHGETIDFVKLSNDLYAKFRREDNGNFDLVIIKKCEYSSKELDSLLCDLQNSYKAERFLGIWRCIYAKEPEFMPERYYDDLLKLNQKYLNINDRHVKEVNVLINKLKDTLNVESFGLPIAKTRGY